MDFLLNNYFIFQIRARLFKQLKDIKWYKLKKYIVYFNKNISIYLLSSVLLKFQSFHTHGHTTIISVNKRNRAAEVNSEKQNGETKLSQT